MKPVLEIFGAMLIHSSFQQEMQANPEADAHRQGLYPERGRDGCHAEDRQELPGWRPGRRNEQRQGEYAQTGLATTVTSPLKESFALSIAIRPSSVEGAPGVCLPPGPSKIGLS